MPHVINWLSAQPVLTYNILLGTHEKIFKELYPWAGRDRLTLTPYRSVRKGEIIFAEPKEIKTTFVRSINQDTLGKVLGGFALAHPFLDGDGLALVLFFSEWARRQKKLIRWDRIQKNEYLISLGHAINGSPSLLDKILMANAVDFPLENPENDLVGRILASID